MSNKIELTIEQWQVIRHSIFSHFFYAGRTLEEYLSDDVDVDAGDLEEHGIFNDYDLHEAINARMKEREDFGSILDVLDPLLGLEKLEKVETDHE